MDARPPDTTSAASEQRPLMIFDGDCGFCRRWIAHWQIMTGDRVAYAPYQEVHGRFPDIPEERFKQAVHLIEPDGAVTSGAEAVFRALHVSGARTWPLWLYRHFPGFGPASRAGYRFVASHRQGFSRLTRLLWGDRPGPATYCLTRWLFLRLLGLVYLIAFASLSVQVVGLVGEDGITPVAERLEWVRGRIGDEAYWRLPTLCWLDPGDEFLELQCVCGIVFSALLIVGLAPVPVLVLLWALYLSLTVAGGVFLSFQWDILLLETGFLAIFFAPLRLWPGLAADRPASRIVLWLLRWLAFRLMFLSGAVKLTSGDPTWRNFTALNFHYETQPLPVWTSWYAHHWPEWFQATSMVVMYVIEMAMPLLIFAPRRPRMLAAASICFLMVLIGLTGNYTFFNLLTCVLCVPLLDDAFLRRFAPRRTRERLEPPRRPGRISWVKPALAMLLAVVLVPLSIVRAAPSLGWQREWPTAVRAVAERVAPYYLVNAYGLFRVMTTSRPEIIIEGSDDGRTWRAYEFRWKPGDPQRCPRFVQPHQPRLDWQMWFAALGSPQRNPWFVRFMHRLQEGSPDVLALLATNPFPKQPPRYLRAMMYDYHFTDSDTRRSSGAWWRRDHPRIYHGPMLRAK